MTILRIKANFTIIFSPIAMSNSRLFANHKFPRVRWSSGICWISLTLSDGSSLTLYPLRLNHLFQTMLSLPCTVPFRHHLTGDVAYCCHWRRRRPHHSFNPLSSPYLLSSARPLYQLGPRLSCLLRCGVSDTNVLRFYLSRHYFSSKLPVLHFSSWVDQRTPYSSPHQHHYESRTLDCRKNQGPTSLAVNHHQCPASDRRPPRSHAAHGSVTHYATLF